MSRHNDVNGHADDEHNGDCSSSVRFRYERDDAGLLLEEEQSSSLPGTAFQGSIENSYDSLNRLITSAPPKSVRYDAADRVLNIQPSNPASSVSFVYDTADELSTATSSAGTSTFLFDLRGNRIKKMPPSAPSLNLKYDQANRLTAFGATATYAYNGDGLRASKKIGVNTEYFSWDHLPGVPQMIRDGTTSYVYGPGGAVLEQISSGGAVLFYHHDQLGSTRLLTDPKGAVQATYTFDAYGNPVTSTGAVSNPFQFAGEFTDSESGLQYLRARYYDPLTAQFLTKDPFFTRTRAAYSYAGDDPKNAIDPSGAAPSVILDQNGEAQPVTDVEISSRVIVTPLKPGIYGVSGTYIGGTIYASSDNGRTWQQITDETIVNAGTVLSTTSGTYGHVGGQGLGTTVIPPKACVRLTKSGSYSSSAISGNAYWYTDKTGVTVLGR